MRRFLHEEDGATMVEYAIMIALIAAVCIVAVKVLQNKLTNNFAAVNNAMQ